MFINESQSFKDSFLFGICESEVPIDYKSLDSIARSNQLMVYGFAHCGCGTVLDRLRADPEGLFDKVFDYDSCDNTDASTTLEGHTINIIPKTYSDDDIGNQCKNVISNLVLANCIRKKQNLPIIPLIFLADVEDNRYPLRAEEIACTSYTADGDKRRTHQEIRRCYKLSTEFDNTPLKEISEIARETIKFVKVSRNEKGTAIFEQIEPVWKQPSWEEIWNKRKQLKQAHTAASLSSNLNKGAWDEPK